MSYQMRNQIWVLQKVFKKSYSDTKYTKMIEWSHILMVQVLSMQSRIDETLKNKKNENEEEWGNTWAQLLWWKEMKTTFLTKIK